MDGPVLGQDLGWVGLEAPINAMESKVSGEPHETDNPVGRRGECRRKMVGAIRLQDQNIKIRARRSIAVSPVLQSAVGTLVCGEKKNVHVYVLENSPWTKLPN